MTDTPEPVRVEVTLPAPFATVWHAFRDRTELYRWHGWEDPTLDDEIQFIYFDHTTVDEAAKTLDIGGHRFAFEDRGDTTTVRVTRSGPVPGVDWSDDYYEDIEEGWLSFLQQLRFALARHPGQDRRTLFFQGSHPASLAVAFGLPGHDGPDDGRYEAATPWGDTLTGQEWFRSPNQRGYTVDQWGDGLLIVHQRPDHSAQVILTSYGLGDADLDALRARIDEWWQRHGQ